LKNRTLVAAALLISTGISTAHADPERPGGAGTVFASGKNAFSFPLATLSDAERTRFAIGNSFFKRNWVEPGNSTTARDGLGPHFIARSCGGCHGMDGRGEPPQKGEQPVHLLMRLSVPAQGALNAVSPALTFHKTQPEPRYGGQFTNAAITGVLPEGEVVIRYKPLKGRFADGTRYTLAAPSYGFKNLAYGAMARDVQVSPRIAPQLIGVGLLEAIPAAEIEANAASQSAQDSPVKGLVNRIADTPSGQTLIGRFGWKANVATLAHQTAGAFLGDIGITSSWFPTEDCAPQQAQCLAAPHGRNSIGEHEIDDKTLADVIFYQATLAPPARRNMNDARVQHGEKLFADAGCAICHRPSYVTGESPLTAFASPALKGQTIYPYTDLLVHDMGDALADHRPDGLANGRQWKTPPLWGVGLIREVNGHQRLLHDGRARGVLEAVLWHDGEAKSAQGAVLKMSKKQRDALVRFVESL
jgi:CxxC motif-containing protein (DUF1111 family)